MSTIESYGTSGSAPKGSRENPYTYEEYERRNREGKWTSAYVEGMGIVHPDVYVISSLLSMGPLSDFWDSYPWLDPWWDPFGDEEEEQGGNSNDNMSSGGSGGSAGGGNGGMGSGGGNGGSSNSNQQVQDAASCSEFTKGFTADMINLLNKYRVKVSFFKGDEYSHYNPDKNQILMNSDKKDLMGRSHEVVHCIQDHVFHRSMKSDEKMNLEYQAYAVSVLFAKGKGEYDSMIDEWRWMNPFIVNEGNGSFYIKKDIFAELNSHDVGWSLTNTGLTYSIQNAENGKQPLVLQQNYHYDWEALLQVLGVKVI